MICGQDTIQCKLFDIIETVTVAKIQTFSPHYVHCWNIPKSYRIIIRSPSWFG